MQSNHLYENKCLTNSMNLIQIIIVKNIKSTFSHNCSKLLFTKLTKIKSFHKIMQNLATSHNSNLISAKTTCILALDPTNYT